jgi:MFS family permease
MSSAYFFFESMFFAVMFCITPETFPPEVRNTAIGLFSSGNSVAAIISPLISGAILDSTGGNFVFVLIYASAIFVVSFCALWVVETNGFNPKSLGKLNFS